MSTILEAQAVIKAKDATGGVFEAIAQKVGRLNRAAQSLNRDIQKQMAIGKAAEEQVTRLNGMQRLGGAISSGAKMAGAAAATYGGARIAKSIVEKTIDAGG